MPRTYSFDHFTAAKPAPSVSKRASTQARQPLKSELHTHSGAVHYGHAHSRTEQLYRQHREEHERQEAMRGPAASGSQAKAPSARLEADSPREMDGERAPSGDLRTLARGAVDSVRQAAREALKGRPLQGARKLAGEAVSGALRVAREVSARTARSSEDIGASKGSGKKP